MNNLSMKKLTLTTALLFCFSIVAHTQTLDLDNNVILAQSTLHCGLKPLPKLGHKIGRCINGRWEQVATTSGSTLHCGLKPLPKLGHKIGRCINGRWEQAATTSGSTLHCGLKPLPKLGHKIGRCINGRWEQVSK